MAVEADEEKIALRLQAYRLWPQRTVVDLYAGKGFLSWLYAREGCERLICVEKNPEYFAVLKRNLAEFGERVKLVRADNLRWLERGGLSPEEPVTFVDFDAFGIPARLLQRFFTVHPIRRALVMAVTDGLLFNFRRMSNADLRRLYLQDFYLGGEAGRPLSIQDLGEYAFQIQRTLLDILAMRHGAQAYPLYFKVNRRCTVAYSAYLVLPKFVGAVDFKRYVGLRRVKTGSAAVSFEGSLGQAG